MKWNYAQALYRTTAPRSTISARRRDARGRGTDARRVLGGAHPLEWRLRAICESREPRSGAREHARRRECARCGLETTKHTALEAPAHLPVEGPREVVQLVGRLVHARVREGDARQIGHANPGIVGLKRTARSARPSN